MTNIESIEDFTSMLRNLVGSEPQVTKMAVSHHGQPYRQHSDIEDEYRCVDGYYISMTCMQTYPCKHYVKTSFSEKPRMMSGSEIYLMLKAKTDKVDSHFKQYSELVRCRTSPTPEEIAEDEAELNRREETASRQQEERAKREVELKHIHDNYSASFYLEKVKAKRAGIN